MPVSFSICKLKHKSLDFLGGSLIELASSYLNVSYLLEGGKLFVYRKNRFLHFFLKFVLAASVNQLLLWNDYCGNDSLAQIISPCNYRTLVYTLKSQQNFFSAMFSDIIQSSIIIITLYCLFNTSIILSANTSANLYFDSTVQPPI